MYKTFKELPKIVQVLLLIIPVVALITEILVRIDLYNEKKATGEIVLLVVGLLTGGLLGLVDLIMIIVKGDLLHLDLN